MHHLKLTSALLGDYETDSFPISVGRSSKCDFVIPNSGVSRVHAEVYLDQQNCILNDQGSSNGTFVEGQKISEAAILESGMRIQFGTCDFTVEMVVDAAPEADVDDPHHINTPVPLLNQVSSDEHTEMLRRPRDLEQPMGDVASESGDAVSNSVPGLGAEKSSAAPGFLAANWPWIIVALLGPLIGWAASQYFG